MSRLSSGDSGEMVLIQRRQNPRAGRLFRKNRLPGQLANIPTAGRTVGDRGRLLRRASPSAQKSGC